MIKQKPQVLVTLDSMKNPNTGLYHFGKSLGLELNVLQAEKNLHINFYIAKRGEDIFGGQADTIKHAEWHKYYFPKAKYFDVIHFSDQFCRLSPTKVSGKKVLTIHDLNQLHENKSLSDGDKKHLNKLKKYISVCDKIVAISQFVADDVKAYFPGSESKIEVIYNGVDELIPVPGHSPAYKPKGAFIYSIGEMMPKKNFHVLPALLQDNDYELIIAGNLKDNFYIKKIEEEAKKFGCTERVKILGPIAEEDKTWYYENCDAFTFPSIAEGFGLPILEAMYFGKPVFLSTKTAVPEIGGDIAFYFQSFEPNEMQRVFKEGLGVYSNNPELKKALIERAKSFSWNETARKYMALYANLLSTTLPTQGQ